MKSMTENIGNGEKVYVAAINTADRIREKFSIERSPESIESRWYKISRSRMASGRDETAAYLSSLARKISMLERHITEQNKLMQSLLKQLELATRCIALLNGGDAE